MLSNQEVAEDISGKFGESVYGFEEPYGLLTLTVTKDKVIPLLQYLKEHNKFNLHFLTDLTGVHFPDNKGGEFSVVYHLHSFSNNFRIRVKTFTALEDIHLPTATVLWDCANWMERETYDFYGIIFDGHPNLIRILNIEEMDYFPMRKEYPLEDSTRQDKVDALFGR